MFCAFCKELRGYLGMVYLQQFYQITTYEMTQA